MKNLLHVFCLLVCLGQGIGADPKDSGSHHYIVVFRFHIDADSKLQDFELAKIFEPLSGSNNPVPIDLPQSFIDAAKKQVEADHSRPESKDGKRSESLLATFFYSPGIQPGTATSMSLGSLSGEMNHVTSFELLGLECQSTFFARDFGKSALFFTYYATPLPKNSKVEREALIDAEIKRCTANVRGSEVISRKDLSTEDQSIIEVVVKSSRNRSLSLRSRFICSSRQMLDLSATTPDDQDADRIKTLDIMFDEFRFK